MIETNSYTCPGADNIQVSCMLAYSQRDGVSH